MGKGTFIATVALLIAVAGAIVAFAAYFKHRNCTLCEDFDDGMMDDDLSDLDYYATQVDKDPEDEYMDTAVAQATADDIAQEDSQETVAE